MVGSIEYLQEDIYIYIDNNLFIFVLFCFCFFFMGEEGGGGHTIYNHHRLTDLQYPIENSQKQMQNQYPSHVAVTFSDLGQAPS